MTDFKKWFNSAYRPNQFLHSHTGCMATDKEVKYQWHDKDCKIFNDDWDKNTPDHHWAKKANWGIVKSHARRAARWMAQKKDEEMHEKQLEIYELNKIYGPMAGAMDEMGKEIESLQSQLAAITDTCPHCGCNELLCGYPNNCAKDKS